MILVYLYYFCATMSCYRDNCNNRDTNVMILKISNPRYDTSNARSTWSLLKGHFIRVSSSSIWRLANETHLSCPLAFPLFEHNMHFQLYTRATPLVQYNPKRKIALHYLLSQTGSLRDPSKKVPKQEIQWYKSTALWENPYYDMSLNSYHICSMPK